MQLALDGKHEDVDDAWIDTLFEKFDEVCSTNEEFCRNKRGILYSK